MLSKRLKAKLSEASLDQLEKELKNLAKTLDKSVETSTKELGKKSLEYMKKQYYEKLESNRDEYENRLGEHIANLNLKPYKNKFKKGFILSSGNDETVVYNEFGTGIVGEGTSRLADDAGYEYNVSSIYKGFVPNGAVLDYMEEHQIPKKYEYKARAALEEITTENTWWYWKKGKWHHTEGMSGKNMYADLVDELRKSAKKHYDTSIKQAIKDYGGK